MCFQEDLRTGNKESVCELLVGKKVLCFEREKAALWTLDSDWTIVAFCGQIFGLITNCISYFPRQTFSYIAVFSFMLFPYLTVYLWVLMSQGLIFIRTNKLNKTKTFVT